MISPRSEALPAPRNSLALPPAAVAMLLQARYGPGPARAGRRIIAVRCNAKAQAQPVKFWKYQGLGNDFILVRRHARARRRSRRRSGGSRGGHRCRSTTGTARSPS
jgi:hypothetical protein